MPVETLTAFEALAYAGLRSIPTVLVGGVAKPLDMARALSHSPGVLDSISLTVRVRGRKGPTTLRTYPERPTHAQLTKANDRRTLSREECEAASALEVREQALYEQENARVAPLGYRPSDRHTGPAPMVMLCEITGANVLPWTAFDKVDPTTGLVCHYERTALLDKLDAETPAEP